MPSPFPGMDPYLESSSVWPDFHNALADVIRVQLNQQLPGQYYALMEARTELGIHATKRVIKPDVAVVRTPRRRPNRDDESAGGVAVAVEPETAIATASGIRIDFFEEPETITFITIRSSQLAGEIVTVIEILSPSNKQSGTDRDRYLTRMEEILQSTASLVEIDLLRSGKRTWHRTDVIEQAIFDSESRADYLVMTSRAWSRSGADMHPISIQDRLPVIPIPLRENEPDVALDLQHVFNLAYDGGPYRRGAVDYSRPPHPPLASELVEWAIKTAAVAVS